MAAPSYTFLGKTISGRFTIPSGIVTVTLDTLELLAKNVPELGILTTKSIGPAPRTGNLEPVYAQIDDSNTYINAVGLANPGYEAFARELKTLDIPEDRFLLISIFGSTPEEFQKIARALSSFADGFELNFSCPHAKGYGQEIGTQPGIAQSYLSAVKAVTDLPVLPKLSPNVGDLEPLVSALIEVGADGFTVINTFGPEDYIEPFSNEPVLSNRVGGVSGRRVRKIALGCIQQVSDAIRNSGRDLPIIGMGGIETASDVNDFNVAGADFFGVGSALTGLDTAEIAHFFEALEKNKECPNKVVPGLMKFHPFHIAKVEQPAEDLKIFWTHEAFVCRPGQFVFVWLPGKAEKPFAPAFDQPSCLVVRAIGPFTSELFKLQEGDTFYMRGPYGVGFNSQPSPKPDAYCLIGGGTGIAPLLLLAKELSQDVPASDIHVFLGGRNIQQIYFQNEFRRYATLHVATDDGSLGFKGFVTELLEDFLRSETERVFHFYNCGPEKMEEAAFHIQQKFPHTGIQTSVERYMKCGVGICGICALDGLRTCVDGPILEEEVLADSKQFGKWHRKKTGQLESIT